jgi:Lrp/AsnC family transcriptional regulator
MAGDVDYMLRVVVPDIAAYDGVYKRLIEQIDLYDVSSSFAMEELKYTTAVPLSYISGGKAKAGGALKPARTPSGH